MKIFIGTSDTTSHLMSGFSYLFNKFWDKNQEVTVLYYNKIPKNLPSNFKSISIGKDNSKKKWANQMFRFLKKIKDKYFIYGLDDYWMLSLVNFQIYMYLQKYLKNNVAKICLSSDVSAFRSKILEKVDDVAIHEACQSAKYRTSTQFSIWRKNYFMQFLRSNWSIWDFELQGSKLAKEDSETILGTDTMVVNYCNLYRRGSILKSTIKKLQTYKILDTLIQNKFIRRSCAQ